MCFFFFFKQLPLPPIFLACGKGAEHTRRQPTLVKREHTHTLIETTHTSGKGARASRKRPNPGSKVRIVALYHPGMELFSGMII